MQQTRAVAPPAWQVANEVLGELFRYRRLDPAAPPCLDPRLACCSASQFGLLIPVVTARRRIEFVLPAFPAKSTSPRKVLGPRPDMAEEQALRYLQRVCDRLTEIYPPGVHVTICSDGRVFSDVVGVRDEDVTGYGRQLQHLIDELGLRDLSLFSLEDVFGDAASFDDMRRELRTRYAEPLATIRERTQTDEDARRLYNGIHRFLVEDRRGVHPDRSRSWLRQDCRHRAYEVIQRSQAWSGLVADRFPHALRLSIHPQRPHDRKIGLRLADDASDAWITPWHGVAVAEPDGWRLRYRHEAESAGAQVVHRDGHPSHFVLDHAS